MVAASSVTRQIATLDEFACSSVRPFSGRIVGSSARPDRRPAGGRMQRGRTDDLWEKGKRVDGPMRPVYLRHPRYSPAFSQNTTGKDPFEAFEFRARFETKSFATRFAQV